MSVARCVKYKTCLQWIGRIRMQIQLTGTQNFTFYFEI